MNEHLLSEKISLYVDRRLTASEMESAERHLAGCSDCARELEHIEGLKVRLGALPVRYAPPRLVAALRRRHLGSRQPRLNFRALWKPLAALAVAGCLWFGFHARQNEDYVDMDA